MRAGDTILALHTTSSQSMTPLAMELRAKRLVQLMQQSLMQILASMETAIYEFILGLVPAANSSARSPGGCCFLKAQVERQLLNK